MSGKSGGSRDVQPEEQVRTAEVISAMCLATDLGMGLPLEHGLHSTLVAARLAERLGVDTETAADAYFGCLLFYVGCTADAEISAGLFEEGALTEHFVPVMFGSKRQTLAGIVRALAGPGSPAGLPAIQGVSRLPRAARGHRRHITAMCEVAEMLSEQLGLATSVQNLFVHFTERWDGAGPARLRGEEIPLPLRIIHVARDAVLQRMLGGDAFAAAVIGQRAGHAFDPAIASLVTGDAAGILAIDEGVSAWHETIGREPGPQRRLHGTEVDRALAAMGHFADLVSPFLVGHSAGVAELATAAAQLCGLSPEDATATRRAGHVHDVGRVAVYAGTWQKAGPLSPGEWEQVRLHGYHSERVLCRAPFLEQLVPQVTSHHERLDGTGYHRGLTAAALEMPARLLAAADAYHAMTEPRPHRPALDTGRAADILYREAQAGCMDRDSVAAVLEAGGHHRAPLRRPAGLTEREAQVIGLLARGLQTKQVGRALGISTKTADRHIQNAYAKIGVSSRAAAALFAMRHGMATWGELPMSSHSDRS